jgi:hypothetical protein
MNISLRNITEYSPADDNHINRLDVLFGYTHIRPEWIISNEIYIPSAPAIIGVKELVVLGTAALLIKNPIISRRFWIGWTK